MPTRTKLIIFISIIGLVTFVLFNEILLTLRLGKIAPIGSINLVIALILSLLSIIIAGVCVFFFIGIAAHSHSLKIQLSIYIILCTILLSSSELLFIKQPKNNMKAYSTSVWIFESRPFYSYNGPGFISEGGGDYCWLLILNTFQVVIILSILLSPPIFRSPSITQEIKYQMKEFCRGITGRPSQK